MARRTDTTLTVRVVAIGTKWARLQRIAKRDTAISVLKVVATTMARVAIVKRVADVGGKMARHQATAHVATRRKAHATCVEKDHPAATARHETATRAHAIDAQTARHALTDHPLKTALTASTILMEIDHPIHPAPARIRQRAATSPTLLCNSLSLAPGERVSWSQPTRSPGCFN
jgi:hypothetical protein